MLILSNKLKIMKHSAAQIESIALTLLPGFIPKDQKETTLSFHFTLPPNSSFKVFFERDNKLSWQFIRYQEVSDKI